MNINVYVKWKSGAEQYYQAVEYCTVAATPSNVPGWLQINNVSIPTRELEQVTVNFV